LWVLCAVLALSVTGCATTAEPVERMQTSVSSSLVRSFEQLVKETSWAAPDAPAVLLQHTSGLRDHSELEAYLRQVKTQPARRWTRAEQLGIALEAGPPLAAPGELFRYSDTGYILLGEIIEAVAGEPLPAAIRRTLDFERLGLRATWFEALEPTPPKAPARQLQLLEGIDAMLFDPSIDLYGGGGLVSTLPDLARLLRLAVRGTLFAQEGTAATMREPSAASRAAGAAGYGMGLSRMEHAGLVCHGHGGFWGTDAWHCPAIDLTITAAVTTTRGRAALRAMTMEAIRLTSQVQGGP
jgi:D-alanyl-D-alanine carboxypeptidase